MNTLIWLMGVAASAWLSYFCFAKLDVPLNELLGVTSLGLVLLSIAMTLYSLGKDLSGVADGIDQWKRR